MKKALLPLVLALGFATSGCLGPDNLYHSLKNWNANLSEKDWVNEVVYIPMHIFVLPLALIGDIVLFNTVNYWSGSNWIKDPGPFPGFTKEKK